MYIEANLFFKSVYKNPQQVTIMRCCLPKLQYDIPEPLDIILYRSVLLELVEFSTQPVYMVHISKCLLYQDTEIVKL